MSGDLVVLGEPAGFEFRVDELSVHAHFKSPSVGRHEDEPLDPGLVLGYEFVGQTDRLRLIVSSLAVDEFDFHSVPFFLV